MTRLVLEVLLYVRSRNIDPLLEWALRQLINDTEKHKAYACG